MFKAETEVMAEIRRRREGNAAALQAAPFQPPPSAASSAPSYEDLESRNSPRPGPVPRAGYYGPPNNALGQPGYSTRPVQTPWANFRNRWLPVCGIAGGALACVLLLLFGLAAARPTAGAEASRSAHQREQQQAAEIAATQERQLAKERQLADERRLAEERRLEEERRLAEERAARARFDALRTEGDNLVKAGSFGRAKVLFLHNQESVDKAEWREELGLRAQGCNNALVYDQQFVPHIEAARTALRRGRLDEARKQLDAAALSRPADPWLVELRDQLHDREWSMSVIGENPVR